MKQFGPIYALASNGKVKMWKGEVYQTAENYGHILYTFGYTDGKHQVQEKYVKTGKNIGKVNETSPYIQACNNAESKYNRKCDEGYQRDKATLSIPILPMLAHSYAKRSHNISWPCYVQPKIDGVRCTVGRDNGIIKMFTRKGKSMTPMVHIEKELERLFDQAKVLDWKTDTLYLDGELYSDELTFQELAGTLRRHENTEETLNKIYFIVFDMFWTDTTTKYAIRKEGLKQLFDSFLELSTQLIKTEKVFDEKEMKEKHNEYIQQGYEGIILRNAKGAYRMKHRSADLQKLKAFKDSEYIIVDYKEGEGVEEGCVIWQCETKTHLNLDTCKFWVRPKGTQEERRDLFTYGSSYLGKYLTVRYQELTDDGIPRFPVGISIRDYE
jgi:DNA ligase-1